MNSISSSKYNEMTKKSATDILKQHEQRITNGRVALLELLMESPKAFPFSELEQQLSVPIDRVTIYRTLQTFEAIGLITRMVDHKGTCVYMINLEEHKNLSVHPHLYCTACDEIVCLPGLPEEYLAKLEKYEIEEIYFLMQGKCRECLIAEKKECGR